MVSAQEINIASWACRNNQDIVQNMNRKVDTQVEKCVVGWPVLLRSLDQYPRLARLHVLVAVARDAEDVADAIS